jgi:hypothetical protein
MKPTREERRGSVAWGSVSVVGGVGLEWWKGLKEDGDMVDRLWGLVAVVEGTVFDA